MTIKEAILNIKELNHDTPYLRPNVEFRAPVRDYKKFYTQEQLDFLWSHNMIEEYQKCGAMCERDCEEYWQFTDKGKRWRIWYATDLWTLIKIYVLHSYKWKFRYDKLKYKLFGIRAGWMDYSDNS